MFRDPLFEEIPASPGERRKQGILRNYCHSYRPSISHTQIQIGCARSSGLPLQSEELPDEPGILFPDPAMSTSQFLPDLFCDAAEKL
ncbi:hypothetical protein [Methanoculleus taiwanensis]|uniref:hypothetical protein n=1 Tax=Methanoculleus taiwanensis TaxID=1550565 RepID=UPI000FFE4B98|nr:hypothetical protein [Methanoculleus taiwanensis]